MTEQQIIETTTVRRHNGQCAYGEWVQLAEAPAAVLEAVAAEVAEAMCRDMRREPESSNTCDSGHVDVGGQRWLYRR